MKRTALGSLIQSMQQNNIVEVVRSLSQRNQEAGNISFLNSFLEIPHFTMESAESIRRSLPRDAWVTSIDLVDAYFHIPIHRGYQKFLQFQTRDTIYQFRALPFGLSPAPWVFTKIMTEFKMLVHVMGIDICQYLDDWLIYSPSHDQCLRDTIQLIPKRKFLFSGIPVRPSFLPGHSNSGSISQNQSTDLLSPAKPRRMCSYVADPARSLCVHRENGSSGTATHPRSPTLHLSTLGFLCFNQQFVDTSSPPPPPGGGRSPLVEVSTQCSRQNQTPSCSQMHRTSAGEHIGMH